jgi:hypothetical protein
VEGIDGDSKLECCKQRGWRLVLGWAKFWIFQAKI